MLKHFLSIWHSFLLSFAALVIVTAFFAMGLNPVELGRYLGSKIGLASEVGSSASVTPNQYNTLALQLEKKDNSLKARESELDEKEKKVDEIVNRWMAYIIPTLAALAILVLLNFWLDHKERKILSRIEEEEKKILAAEARLEEWKESYRAALDRLKVWQK